MKFSVPRWGGIVAVLLLAGLGLHATSSSPTNTIAGLPLDDEAQDSSEVFSELMASVPEEEVIAAPAAPMTALSAKPSISPETLAKIPFSLPDIASKSEKVVLDTPPETRNSEDQDVIDRPFLDQTGQANEPDAEDQLPEDALAAEEEPAPMTEEQARMEVLDLLGGEDEYRRTESDMALAYAAARKALRERGIRLSKVKMLAVIDFTLPSYDRRLAIYNPRTGEESRHLVAHGHHSGELYLKSYSNIPGSLQSSPGLYRVGSQYTGEHGRSLRLQGLEKNVNDLASKRAVVLHSAWYVSYKTILENQLELGVPRIGRSHGCPAVSADDLSEVLQKLQPGSYLFIYPVPAFVPSPEPEPKIPATVTPPVTRSTPPAKEPSVLKRLFRRLP